MQAVGFCKKFAIFDRLRIIRPSKLVAEFPYLGFFIFKKEQYELSN